MSSHTVAEHEIIIGAFGCMSDMQWCMCILGRRGVSYEKITQK